MQGKALYIPMSCYDDDILESIGLDVHEVNVLGYNRIKKLVSTMEIEDFSQRNIAKQLYSLSVGLGKKQNVITVDSYLSSKDCQYAERADL